MAVPRITPTRGLFRLWVVFSTIWLIAFTGIATQNFYQFFWMTHQRDVENYKQTLVDNATLEKERCGGPTPGKRCNEHAIASDPSSPTNAELDKEFRLIAEPVSPPVRPTMMPLASQDGFEWVFKYVLIGLAGPIILLVLGGAMTWVAKGFVGSSSL
jgi:hypothetical protein